MYLAKFIEIKGPTFKTSKKKLKNSYLSGHGLACAAWTGPISIWDFIQRWFDALQVVGRGTAVAAEEFASFLADATELHVLIFLVDLLDLGAVDLAVGTAPLAFGSFVQLRVETHQVVSPWASITQYDLSCKCQK